MNTYLALAYKLIGIQNVARIFFFLLNRNTTLNNVTFNPTIMDVFWSYFSLRDATVSKYRQ